MLTTRLPGKYAPVQPPVRRIVGNSPGNHANNIYSPGSDKLPEVQLYRYMLTLCQAGNRVIRAFSDVQKPFLFSDLAVKAASQKIKKRFFNVREGSDYQSGK